MPSTGPASARRAVPGRPCANPPARRAGTAPAVPASATVQRAPTAMKLQEIGLKQKGFLGSSQGKRNMFFCMCKSFNLWE
jgi:hypothetical protein